MYQEPYQGPAILSIEYSDVKGGQASVHVDTGCTLNWGQGNIDADPLFVELGYWDANGLWIEGAQVIPIGALREPADLLKGPIAAELAEKPAER